MTDKDKKALDTIKAKLAANRLAYLDRKETSQDYLDLLITELDKCRIARSDGNSMCKQMAEIGAIAADYLSFYDTDA